MSIKLRFFRAMLWPLVCGQGAEYEISVQDAATLTATREFADRFEVAAKKAKSPKRVAALLTSELTMRLRHLRIVMRRSWRAMVWRNMRCGWMR